MFTQGATHAFEIPLQRALLGDRVLKPVIFDYRLQIWYLRGLACALITVVLLVSSKPLSRGHYKGSSVKNHHSRLSTPNSTTVIGALENPQVPNFAKKSTWNPPGFHLEIQLNCFYGDGQYFYEKSFF